MKRAAILVCGLAAAPSLLAQAPPISPGDPVRITAPDVGVKERVAVFDAMRGDTLFLRGTGSDTSHWSVPVSSITRLEVNHGNKPPERKVWQGAAIGGGVGFFGFYITRALPANPCLNYCKKLSGPQGWTIIAEATLAGALIGAGIGYTIKTAPFTRVPVPPTIALLPADRGVMLAVAWRF